jgi:hypothetical protein
MSIVGFARISSYMSQINGDGRVNQISLDNLNDEANEKYSKAFFSFFEEKLGVPGERGYM